MKDLLAAIAVLFVAPLCWAESAGGIAWTAPSSWKSQAARPMRAATYAVTASSGDSEDGECAVYYFGPGQGGTVQANLDRWINQFQQPGGKPSSQVAKLSKRTVHGIALSTVDVSGAYTGMGGPMAASKSVKPGYRMLGAIAESPEGSVFFKFTGPAKTVAAHQKQFEAMLESIRGAPRQAH